MLSGTLARESTILNALCGTARGQWMPFRSGLSVASGMTTALQTEVVNGVRYSDTPGLDDVELKQRAAAAIADAIRLGGSVRLLFVLTMEAGRIRGSNLATIRIILDALTAADIDVDRRFTVALNNMTAGEMAAWGDPATDGAAVLRSQLGCTAAVDQLVYLPRIAGIVDAADAKFPEATRDCLASAVEAMETMDVVVGTDIVVQVDEVARLTTHYESELANHRRRVQMFEEEQEERAARHKEALQQAQRRFERDHSATLEGMRRVQETQASEIEDARKWNMVAGVVAAAAGMMLFKVPFFL